MAPLVYFVFWYIRCVMSLFKFIFLCVRRYFQIFYKVVRNFILRTTVNGNSNS